MKDFTGRERRASPRAKLDLRVEVSREDMPILPVTGINLSASGLYVLSRRGIGELSRVDLLLRIDGTYEIPARAVVIREEQLPEGDFGIGMFFTSIRDEHRALIAELVAQACSKQKDDTV